MWGLEESNCYVYFSRLIRNNHHPHLIVLKSFVFVLSPSLSNMIIHLDLTVAVRPSGTLTSWKELSSFIPTLSRNHNLENRNHIPDSESLAQNHKYPHSSSGFEIPLFINRDHIIMQSTLAKQGVITKISFQALPSHLGSFELNMSDGGPSFTLIYWSSC